MHGIGSAFTCQIFRTHRSFTTHGNERSLKVPSPFQLISLRIRVYDAIRDNSSKRYTSSTALQGMCAGSIVNQTSAQVSSILLSEMCIIGAAEQEWAPLRRKYNLFLPRHFNQNQSNLHAPSSHPASCPSQRQKRYRSQKGVPSRLAFRNSRELMNHFSHGISHFSQKTNASLGP